MTSQPPKYAERFFRWICMDSRLEDLEGDLYELFERDLKNFGIKKARRRYLLNTLTLLRPIVLRNIFKTQDSMDTILHYLKSTIRTSLRHKGFSGVTLLGLLVAFVITIIVGTYTLNELSYDQYRTKNASVYRVYNQSHVDNSEEVNLPIVPPTFGPSLRDQFPEVKKAARVLKDYGGSFFELDEKGFEENNGVFAESEIFDILEIDLSEGSLVEMDQPARVVLSENLFRKIFGDNPFNNQVVKVSGRDVKIVGIFNEIPEKSHFQTDYIFSFKTGTQYVTEERMNSWVWQQFYTYVELQDGVTMPEIEGKFQRYVEETARDITMEMSFYYIPHFQPITDIHLYSSDFQWEIAHRGNLQSLIFINIAAIILLVIAIFNFVNLFSIQTLKKLKEISIRRTVGAQGGQIILQLFTYSTFYIVLSVLGAIGISLLLMPSIEQFMGQSIDFSIVVQQEILLLIALTLVALCVICTLYPIIISRKFRPVETIKGIPKTGGKGLDPRLFMVGVQYALGVGLIFASLIVQKQFNHLSNSDMGFNPDRLVSITIPGGLPASSDVINSQLLSNPNISAVSFAYGTPGGVIAGDGVKLPHRENQEVGCNMIIADHNYVSTLDMEIIEGRDFRSGEADIFSGFIINETAVESFGFTSAAEAIGKPLDWTIWGTNDSLKRGEVIGVVKDFNFKSKHNAIGPMVLHIAPQFQNTVLVRMGEGDIPQTISYLEDWWKDTGSNRPLQYEFVDDLFAKEYKTEQQLNILFLTLTLVGILMATIGIFSLVTFNIGVRLKEISIRKVLGAKVSSIFSKLVRQYLILAAITLLISLPIVTLILQDWLNGYAYQVDIGVDSYLIVSLVILAFTLLTVGGQAYKAAISNPVKNLRSE